MYKRVFLTGDTHGVFEPLYYYAMDNKLTKDDLIIILGDAGLNYFLNIKDFYLKKFVSKISATFLCIHGNHEERPYKINGYEEVDFCDGKAYWEKEFPNIYFAKDGENYKINNHNFFVIGGAYSVDKDYRISCGYQWFETEQPNDEIKNTVIKKLDENGWSVDYVLTHTAPLKYEPVEMFLSGIDQSKVDKTTEKWLNSIEKKLKYNKWYFGHYHGDIDKSNKVHMLYKKVIEIKD